MSFFSVSQRQTRMRKQEFKDAGDITSGSQQEDEACDDSVNTCEY